MSNEKQLEDSEDFASLMTLSKPAAQIDELISMSLESGDNFNMKVNMKPELENMTPIILEVDPATAENLKSTGHFTFIPVNQESSGKNVISNSDINQDCICLVEDNSGMQWTGNVYSSYDQNTTNVQRGNDSTFGNQEKENIFSNKPSQQYVQMNSVSQMHSESEAPSSFCTGPSELFRGNRIFPRQRGSLNERFMPYSDNFLHSTPISNNPLPVQNENVSNKPNNRSGDFGSVSNEASSSVMNREETSILGINQMENVQFYTLHDRDSHNAKERNRRNRIKLSCQTLREIVPGLGDKTDKATVFEYTVQYLLYLKQRVGVDFDKEFIEQYGYF